MTEKCAVIITGASRGFGQAIALAFAKSTNLGAKHYILTGRNLDGLKNTQALILQTDNHATFSTESLNLSDASTLQHSVNTILKHTEAFSRIYLINNAGSLGPMFTIGSREYDTTEVIETINANITSVCLLTNALVHQYLAKPAHNGLTVVNISSLAALQPFHSKAIYCTGKAARDMYHRVLAEEQKDKNNNSIRVLNYAPGPLDTDMQTEIRESKTIDKNSQLAFINMKEKNQLVTCEASATKLLELLSVDTYESGAHLDYYDV